MIPARTSKRYGNETRLLTLQKEGGVSHLRVKDLVQHFKSEDVLVVNRSATLPSSFQGRIERTNQFLEIRLAAFQGPNKKDLSTWLAFSFGEGDWRKATEDRKAPPEVRVGDKVIFGSDFYLEVIEVHFSRLLKVKFRSEKLIHNLYRYGKPIQYSYLNEPLANWDQQTIFAGPPISVEPPSAGFPFTWDLMLELTKKGVQVVDVLHGAGISSSGSESLDKLLPLTEWYEISQATARTLNMVNREKNKVVALGTSVLRALESSWDGSKVIPGSSLTNLKVTPGYQVRTVNALVTGMHEVGASHRMILDSLCPVEQIRRGYLEAEALGYLGHEYGDLTLLDCSG